MDGVVFKDTALSREDKARKIAAAFLARKYNSDRKEFIDTAIAHQANLLRGVVPSSEEYKDQCKAAQEWFKKVIQNLSTIEVEEINDTGTWGTIYAVPGEPDYLFKLLTRVAEEDRIPHFKSLSLNFEVLHKFLFTDTDLNRYFPAFSNLELFEFKGGYEYGYAMELLNGDTLAYHYGLPEAKRQNWATKILDFWSLQRDRLDRAIWPSILLIPDFKLENLMFDSDGNLKIIDLDDIATFDIYGQLMEPPTVCSFPFVGTPEEGGPWTRENPSVCLYQTWASICFAVCSLWETQEVTEDCTKFLQTNKTTIMAEGGRFEYCLPETMPRGWDSRYIELRAAVQELAQNLISNSNIDAELLAKFVDCC